MPGGSQVWARAARLAGAAALAGLAAAPVSAAARPALQGAYVAPDALSGELRAGLAASPDRELAGFYAARAYRPLWIDERRVRPEAQALIGAVRDAAADGLTPADYRPLELAATVREARAGHARSLARAELALSRTLAAYGADLHRPKPGVEVLYIDAAVRPTLTTGREVLETVAAAPSLTQGLWAARRMNPIYVALRGALAVEIARRGPNAALIRINLERARALPADLGRRYVLVDVADQRLWAYEDGRPRETTRVVVGKSSQPTPALAGMIRYAVFHPYWNVPTDLVRDTLAPRVLHDGLSYFRERGFEALSDWSDEATVLDPAGVDWKAVAAGRTELRVRQQPGPDNMMGQVKFVLPNDLGIYLHDTPLKALFVDGPRTESSGCVRLEDASRISRWLLGPYAAVAAGGTGPPEQRVTLIQPMPVYIVYLTAMAGPGGLSLRPDIYGHDAALLASLAKARPRLAAASAPLRD